MKRLFDRFDGASLITSKAPPNAKIAVVFGANLTEMLFTVEQPSFSNGCTIGKTCDGRDFILNCLIPLVMIDLPDDFPREVEENATKVTLAKKKSSVVAATKTEQSGE